MKNPNSLSVSKSWMRSSRAVVAWKAAIFLAALERSSSRQHKRGRQKGHVYRLCVTRKGLIVAFSVSLRRIPSCLMQVQFSGQIFIVGLLSRTITIYVHQVKHSHFPQEDHIEGRDSTHSPLVSSAHSAQAAQSAQSPALSWDDSILLALASRVGEAQVAHSWGFPPSPDQSAQAVRTAHFSSCQ